MIRSSPSDRRKVVLSVACGVVVATSVTVGATGQLTRGRPDKPGWLVAPRPMPASGAASGAPAGLAAPGVQGEGLCISGPLPGNAGNRLELCTPAAATVEVQILPDAVSLSFDTPPRSASTYVSPVTASRWSGLDVGTVVPGLLVDGEYLAVRDQRIHFDVLTVDSLGTGTLIDEGEVGRDRVRIAWSSIHESTPTRGTGGVFDLPANYAGARLRFDFPNLDPTFPPDTTVLAGLRFAAQPGLHVVTENQAVFDVEDFEGWHIWRWGEDPTSPTYLALAEFSKLTDLPRGFNYQSLRLTYFDEDVFDGFVYHYTVTTYDQGFRRTAPGDFGVKNDSPLAPATLDGGGAVAYGPGQFRVEYRKEPPTRFRPIAAIPNPFRDSAIDPTRQETQKVSFVNAPPRGTLYIYTLAGDLVFQRDHNLPTIGTIDWDTRNQSSLRVASGVYIYKIVDLVSGEQSYGRLAIIR